MRCLKSFGERIMARDPDRQTAKIEVSSASLSLTASTLSAPPRLSEWRDDCRERGSTTQAGVAQQRRLHPWSKVTQESREIR